MTISLPLSRRMAINHTRSRHGKARKGFSKVKTENAKWISVIIKYTHFVEHAYFL